ncbi:DUF4403 family protein [soil metagenome]
MPQEEYFETAQVKQVSTINIPVEIPVSELEKQINKQVQGLIYEDDGSGRSGRENVNFKIWKRENISVVADDDLFHIKVPLKAWAKADLKFDKLGLNLSESKDTEFALDLNFTTRLSVNTDYQIISETAGNGYEWIKKPVLKLGPLEVSLGSFAGPIIENTQKEISQLLDQQIKDKINIKKHVELAWNNIQKPYLLSKEHNAWLKLIPVEILMTPLHGDSQQINATIGIKGYTQSYINQRPTDTIASVMPPLQLVDSINDDFAINFTGEISHARANEILTQKFINKNFKFKNGKREVTITDLDLYGSGENLIIKADLTGSIDGTIYLSGIPHYDETTRSLVVHNLDYDLDTKNALAKTANWLLKSRMVKNFEEALQIPLGNQMDQARSIIEQNIDHKTLAKGIILNGSLDELTPSAVYMTSDAIVALIKATGKAEVKINGL